MLPLPSEEGATAASSRRLPDVPWGVSISGDVSRGEKMTLRGTDQESYITEYASAYEDYIWQMSLGTHHRNSV